MLGLHSVRTVCWRDTLEDDDLFLDTFAAGAAAGRVPMTAHKVTADGPGPNNGHSLLTAVLASLEDDKAEDVVQIDLRGKSEIGDYMVIATGRSTRQVSAMAEKLVDRLKQSHGVQSRVEGRETGDWVLIDAGDVIIHLFRPEVREFYQLEKMWLPGAPTPAGTAAPKLA